MATEASFLRQISSNHDDDVTRLVYADWLDEHGQPGGEFLRLDVRLAGLGDAASPEQEAELQALSRPPDQKWVARVRKRYDLSLDRYDAGANPVAHSAVIRAFPFAWLHQAPERISETLPVCLGVTMPRDKAERMRDTFRQHSDESTKMTLKPTTFSRPVYQLVKSNNLPLEGELRQVFAEQLARLLRMPLHEAMRRCDGSLILLQEGLTMRQLSEFDSWLRSATFLIRRTD